MTSEKKLNNTYKIKYKRGVNQSIPDALSRPVGAVGDAQDVTQTSQIEFLGLNPQQIREAQREDKCWSQVLKYFEGGPLPKKLACNRPIYAFEMHDDILYLRREEMGKSRLCVVVPRTLRAIACYIAHNSSHLGERKSVAKARQ